MPGIGAPTLVTGATGFIASRIVEQLLATGRIVRGTVRSLKKEHGHRASSGAARAPASVSSLVEADLLAEGSFDRAAAGCAGVMHAASPYVLTVTDPQRELVDPGRQRHTQRPRVV